MGHWLAEFGILCVELVTELIVAGDIVPHGASCGHKQVDVQQINAGDHTLLFLTYYRGRSVCWIDGKLAPSVTVTVPNLDGRKVSCITFDKDLTVSSIKHSGTDLKLRMGGFDVRAMILLMPDDEFISRYL